MSWTSLSPLVEVPGKDMIMTINRCKPALRGSDAIRGSGLAHRGNGFAVEHAWGSREPIDVCDAQGMSRTAK